MNEFMGSPGGLDFPSSVVAGIAAWAPFVWAFVSAVLLTGTMVKIAPGRGWVAAPRPDRWNSRVVAMFGGLPIILAFASAAILLLPSTQTVVLLLLTIAMGMVGLVDDIVGVGPKTKLLAQGSLACIATMVGIVFPLTGYRWIDLLFTLFWITGITNAINLIDNMDGLAAGISIIALAQAILLAGPSLLVSRLALCMLASIGGFLLFNVNPARIFMGDIGSLSIGFFLACVSIKTTEHVSGLASVILVPFLVLFIPVFDTLLVTVTRKLHGKPISQGGCDHASHRLVLIGLNERQAVLLLYSIAILAGLIAFLWKFSHAELSVGYVSLFLLGTALFWLYLARVRIPPPTSQGVQTASLSVKLRTDDNLVEADLGAEISKESCVPSRQTGGQ
jgi:UDP-GlcNAc:undecaprenyl-phosphate/decaprenyl-phosphate GlcNAc-1-phosphate transferase